MKISEFAFTAYPVSDLKRARQFYEIVLGLKTSRSFGDDKDGWIEFDLGGATLAITNGTKEWQPAAGGGSIALEVDDFPGTMAHLAAQKVPVVLAPTDGSVCQLAIVADPDGNSLIIHKRKTG